MTYIVKHRGPTRPVPKEFCCPVHGQFTADADRDAESAPCPAFIALNIGGAVLGLDPRLSEPCGAPSPWSPRKVPTIRMRRVEATRGKSDVAEHPGWCDTSNLEEGQDFEDWQADRDKVHEELRKERVMELVRSDR